MADPFSFFTGALTVGDVCIRVGTYLRSVVETAKNVDKEIESLEREIKKFSDTYSALEQLCPSGAITTQKAPEKPPGVHDPASSLWDSAAALVKEGLSIVERLRELLLKIMGPEESHKFQKIDDLQKAVKILSKNKEYDKLRRRFIDLNMELGTILTAINLVFNYKSLSSLEQLPSKVSLLQEQGLQLKAQIKKLERADINLESSIMPAKAAIQFSSLNEHYYVKQPDTSMWTGRKKQLDKLRDDILNPTSVNQRVQKRFIVHGIPGAGKTQFCSKFAQEYRESFWAIFWIDASSLQNAVEDWKKIAKIGRKDANEEAGKVWLSNLQSPWLLIIDGADRLKKPIETQFPSGDRGCILITTRNPRLSSNVTGFIALDKLEEDEADELLQKATKHVPWDVSAKTSASNIARHLGYLALALVHAGSAIVHEFCTLHNYIPYFNKIISRFHKKDTIHMDNYNDEYMGALTSFDIIYSGLEARMYRHNSEGRVSRDAIELINIFSFFHSSDICVEILTNAGRNLHKAATAETTHNSGDFSPLEPSKSFLQRLRDYAEALYIKFKRNEPVYPRIFNGVGNQPFDESRARKAIDLLVQMSLLSESSESGSYSMHPLIHLWVRERLGTSARALWCEVAADVIACSIKLPPMAEDLGDEDFYVRIAKHVNEVRQHQDEVKEQLWKNCQNASYIRTLIGVNDPFRFTVTDAINSAKFSRVYMTNSSFENAEKLQRLVRDFLVKHRGADHPILVPISIALSLTLWHLARASEAQELQEDALRICRAKFGETHPQTLKAMDALGEIYWQRGFLKEAKALHQSAISGMEGKANLKREMLKAKAHLGRVYEWYLDNEMARQLFEEAADELAKEYGADDLDASIAKDSLAMVLLQLDDTAHSKQAYDLMLEIHESRLKKFGEEHVYTLWAACNLARTLTVRGSLENDHSLFVKAKDIFHDGLEICRRNLGPNHIGTLMGEYFLTNVYVAEKRYDEAEREYKDIAERQKHIPTARAGSHRDRLVTMQKLVELYEIQGKLEDALLWCDTILKELDDMGGQHHPWRQKMAVKREKIVKRLGT